jgi:hypothetical protein
MKFKIEDVKIDASTIDMMGKGEFIRMTHKPTGIEIEHRSPESSIRRATKDRLLAEIKVLVEHHEPIEPS